MIRKPSRFRKPEFKDKLTRARNYERSPGRRRFYKILFVAAGLTLFYFLVISSTFLVRQAEGAPEPVNAVLARLQKKRIGYLIPQNHILVLSRNRLLAAIQEEMPEVRSIKIFKKHWPGKISLVLEEREPLYVWQSGTDFFLLDQDGVIFQKIPSFTPETFSQILITDQSGAQAQAGDQLDIQPILGFIQEIKSGWPARINQTSFVSFAVPAMKSQDLLAKTALGFSIYFDLERSAESQLASLALVLREQIKPETYSGLSYIDLRLPTTAYYCYKDALCALKE